MYKLFVYPLLIWLASSTAFAADLQHADTLIRHATIINIADEKTVPHQAIAIKNDVIVAVGLDEVITKAWKAENTIDVENRYIIPGLWDMHVHFGGGPDLIEENKALLPLYVANGITTIRDCSGDLPNQVLQWREEINRGKLFGPRLLTSGAKIEGIAPVWKGTIEVGSKADVHKALDRLQQDGVDFVKITENTLKPELFLYALSEAKKRGLQTSGHIPMSLTVQQAIEAGLSSIEHIGYAFKAGSNQEQSIVKDFANEKLTRQQAAQRLRETFDRTTALKAYRTFAQHNVYVTPTLNGSQIITYLDQNNHNDDEYLKYIGPKLRETYNWRIERANKATSEQVKQRHQRFERNANLLSLLQQAGVTVMAGTDAGFLNSFNYPGVGLHDELNLFVKYGLSPVEALRSATQAGPAWFGQQNKYGSISQGKVADIVILNKNPLESIAATRSIETVVMKGQVYDREALDKMMAKAKHQVSQWEQQRKTEQ